MPNVWEDSTVPAKKTVFHRLYWMATVLILFKWAPEHKLAFLKPKISKLKSFQESSFYPSFLDF